jgi:hypothetical protein
MPYIYSEKRLRLDTVLDAMEEAQVLADGGLNYILFKYCRTTVQPGYQNYKNFIAELTECGEEIRRRLLAPYEDGKRAENGDV